MVDPARGYVGRYRKVQQSGRLARGDTVILTEMTPMTASTRLLCKSLSNEVNDSVD